MTYTYDYVIKLTDRDDEPFDVFLSFFDENGTPAFGSVFKARTILEAEKEIRRSVKYERDFNGPISRRVRSTKSGKQ